MHHQTTKKFVHLLRFFAIAFLSLGFWGTPAAAAPAHTPTSDQNVLVKDWATAEVNDPYLQTTVCQASTHTSQGAFPVDISVNIPKQPLAPPYILLNVYSAQAPTSALVKMTSKVSHLLLPLQQLQTPEVLTSYLYLPMALPDLYTRIRDESWLDLMLDPKGTPLPVRISLGGSSKALQQLAHCLGTAKVNISSDYFKVLNQPITDALPTPPAASVPDLFQATLQAFKGHLEKKNLDVKITALQGSMKKLIQAENNAKDELETITIKRNKILKNIDDHQSALTIAETNLAQKRSEQISLESSLVQAQDNLKAKAAIYIPLRDRMQPLNDRVRVARDKRNRHSAEVDRLANIINSYPGQISDLEDRRNRLENRISSLQIDLSRLQWEERRREDEYRRYDINRETDQILQRDPSYRQLDDNARRAEFQIREANGRASIAQLELSRAQASLARCMAQPPENRNCIAEQSAVQIAQNQLNLANSQVRQAESDLRIVEMNKRALEANARREANNRARALEWAYNQAAAETLDVENQIANARRASLEASNQSQQLQNELSMARMNLPNQQTALDQARLELTDATRARDALAIEIGYAAAEQAYVEAQAAVDKLDEQIKSVQSQIRRLSAQIASEQEEIAAWNKKLEKIRPSFEAAVTKLSGIQTQLAPSRAQEAQLQKDSDAQNAILNQNRALYQSILRLLLQ